MPLSVNPNTGETFYLDKQGSWQPAKNSVNPTTKQLYALDEAAGSWSPVNVHGQGILSYVDDAVRALASGMTAGYADRFAAKMTDITGVGGQKNIPTTPEGGNLLREQVRTQSEPGAIKIPGEIAGAVASTVAGGPLVRGAGEALPAVAGAVSKIPGAVKTMFGGAAVGGLAGSSEGDTIGQRLENAAIGGAGGAATGGILAGAGKLFGAAGDKIMTSVIRPTARDIADGFSLDTIKQFNLGGSLNATYAKTKAALGDLSSQLRDKLGASKATINLPDIVDQTRKELAGSGKLKGFGANQKINSALDNLSEEVKIVGNDLSIPDAQVVKQASGAFGAWQYGRPDPESKASEVVFNTFYNKLKTAIENASPDGVKEINQQLSKLIPVNNALIRRMPVAERNYMLSLSDMVGLAASTSHPSGLGLTLMNMAQKSGAVGNALTKLDPALRKAAAPTSILSGLGAPSVLQPQD